MRGPAFGGQGNPLGGQELGAGVMMCVLCCMCILCTIVIACKSPLPLPPQRRKLQRIANVSRFQCA
jgi:hypothetical protein